MRTTMILTLYMPSTPIPQQVGDLWQVRGRGKVSGCWYDVSDNMRERGRRKRGGGGR